MPPLSILIVGCGVAGPTLASFLQLSDLPAKEKPQVTILERAPSLRVQGQNIDIRGAGVTLMRKLGIETAVRANLTGEEGVQFVDSNNQVWAKFGADKSGEVQTGTSDIEILRGRLAEICYKRSKSISDEVQKEGGAGIEYIFGDYLDDIDQDGDLVHVRFAKSGNRRSFDLVVAADGLQSRTRGMVWGQADDHERVKRVGMYAGFFSLPATADDDEWRRWYRAPGRVAIMTRPSGKPDRITAILSVCSEEDDRLRQLAADGRKGVEAQKALLKEYFHGAGWQSERMIREMEATDDFYYDMVAQVKMDRWSKGRVVLLGDAGYCASPLSGMGTTLGMTGAYNLAGAILRHPDDHSAAFEMYESKMRPTVDRAQRLAPGQPWLFNPETAWGIAALHLFVWSIWRSGIQNLMFRILGPPANAVPVEDYGFKTVADTPLEMM